jgi:isopenicillin N synthase-like dioxygenase
MSDIVVLEYQDLLSDKDLSTEIMQAYGAGSIGAVAIRGIPNWADICSRTLPLGHKLASLPAEKLKSLEDEGSMYNAGWSLGKEKMGDTPDFSKASFYFNPLTDNPTPELRSDFPWACPLNKWPLESDISNFKSNCCEVGQIMKSVAVELSRHIDNLLASRVVGYESGSFYQAMVKSNKAKSRMLYYYPIQNSELSSASGDNWIAWHNDSGFLTCLAPELFLDHNTGCIIDNPEPSVAGLWIAQRYSFLLFCVVFSVPVSTAK